MFQKGSPAVAARTITAENQFTNTITLDCGEACTFSFILGSLAGTTINFQRTFDGGVTWRDMSNAAGTSNFTASIELQMVAAERCEVRAGCKTGGFGSGAGSVRIGKG